MLETIGKTLAKARHSKQLTVEDAEHATCIPHDRIRELEGDDYSHFANLTYAKSFLKLYSDYLGVDTSEYRHELSLYEVDDFGADPLSNEFAKEDEPKKSPQIISRLVLLLLVAAMGAFVYVEFFDQRNGADPKEGNSDLVKSPDPDEGLPGPGAKPPGGIPSKVTPEAAEEKPPENPEVIPPKDPEVIEVLPSLPIPEDAERVKIGGEELPVLPAVVIEDDELLNPPPADEGNGEEENGDMPEDADSPEIAVADGEIGQDEPDGDGARTGGSEEGDSGDSGAGVGEPTEENPEVDDLADGNAAEGEPVEGEDGQDESTEEEPEQDEVMEEEAGGEGSGDVGAETGGDDPAEDDSDAGDTTEAGSEESGVEEDGTGEFESGESDPVEDDSDASDAGTEDGGAGESEPGDSDPAEGDSEPSDPTETETETEAGDGESVEDESGEED